MRAADLLLALPFAGLLLEGFRSPWAWTAGAAVLSGTLLAARRRLAFGPLLVWLPWLAWAAVSAAASGQPAASLPALARWAGVLAFAAAAPQLWAQQQRRRWLDGLLAAAVVLGAAGLATGGRAVLAGLPGNAMTGLLPPYYNYTAFVEAAAFAAAAALSARGERLFGRRWPLWLLLAGSGGWLVLARSRGALIAAAVGAAVPALRRRGRARALLPAAGVLVLLAAAATAFMTARGVAGSSYMLKPERADSFRRPQLWLAAARSVADHPLLGEGPGQFEKGFRRHAFPAEGFGPARYVFSSDHAHSEPLELAAETGLAGLGLFAAALLWGVLGPAAEGAEADAALAAAAAMGAVCLVDNMLQVPSLALLLFGALACARARLSIEPEPRASRAWAAAAAVGLALAALAPLPGALAAAWSSEARPPGERGQDARRWSALFPLEPRPREAWARALLARRPPDFAGALQQLERASALAPTNAFYLVWRAELLRAMGRWDEAEPLARRALELEPNFLQARLLLAEADARAGRGDEASRQLDEVERLSRKWETGPGYAGLMASFDAGRFEALRRSLKRKTR